MLNQSSTASLESALVELTQTVLSLTQQLGRAVSGCENSTWRDDLRYVIKSSYGNDSIALIQWCVENGLKNCAVLYNDTGWSGHAWAERVERCEAWVRTLGYEAHRTKSMGLAELVRLKKGWPRQGIQFCTQELKIYPTERWLDENDPFGFTTFLVGVRREESKDRANFPERTEHYDRAGRTRWAPLFNHCEIDRDLLILRAGFEPLVHKSDECFPCINSNRSDLTRLAEHP